MYKQLIDKIKEYNNIVIYRHQRPDGDAAFSTFAFYEFLKLNFPNKNILLYGKDEYDKFPYSNIIDEDTISKSLAFVLDTSVSNRVDDDSFKKASFVIKIDHHPEVDNFGDYNFCNERTAACAELLAEILLSNDFKKYQFSEEIYRYLYCGLLTDSNGFKTSSTTPRTMQIAGELAVRGNLDICALNNYLFSKDLKTYEKISKMRNLLKVKNGVGYIICDENKLKEIGFDHDDVKNNVDTFGLINGLNIWAVFAINKKTHLYDASVRSNTLYVINDWCSEFNGGGHKNACGIKNLTLKDVQKVIQGLEEISKNPKKKRIYKSH